VKPISIKKHIKQSRETSCGAAALAMVYQNLGKTELTEEVLWDKLSLSRPGGGPDERYLRTLPMAQSAKEFGLSYFWGLAVMNNKKNTLQPLKEFISRAIPVVVCQKISEENQWGHFRVVVGVGKGFIYLHDPHEDKMEKMTTARFMELWKSGSNNEVVGGEFFAIFKHQNINKDASFLVRNFESSISSFKATSLSFI
jgi:predicted double-glycine peptidase